ncbi:hypothetical protein RRG08_053402 [Elysia crispata]|uniref:Uncharacterized protein n=1 Tax=Elysia crispata TaxID=231223 RepID=A0AAE0ZFG0_9GAST|nr:hypothetical protein RRG08_053402 [Elysia crispata]
MGTSGRPEVPDRWGRAWSADCPSFQALGMEVLLDLVVISSSMLLTVTPACGELSSRSSSAHFPIKPWHNRPLAN